MCGERNRGQARERAMVSICRARLGSIFSRKIPRNRYAFAMRKLDMIHMRSPCESICIVGKNKEDGAFRCHLLFGLLIRFTEWGYWRTDFEGKSPADERRCSYLLRARKRRFSPKSESQDYHSTSTLGVSPDEAVITSSVGVKRSIGVW